MDNAIEYELLSSTTITYPYHLCFIKESLVWPVLMLVVSDGKVNLLQNILQFLDCTDRGKY